MHIMMRGVEDGFSCAFPLCRAPSHLGSCSNFFFTQYEIAIQIKTHRQQQIDPARARARKHSLENHLRCLKTSRARFRVLKNKHMYSFSSRNWLCNLKMPLYASLCPHLVACQLDCVHELGKTAKDQDFGHSLSSFLLSQSQALYILRCPPR